MLVVYIRVGKCPLERCPHFRCATQYSMHWLLTELTFLILIYFQVMSTVHSTTCSSYPHSIYPCIYNHSAHCSPIHLLCWGPCPSVSALQCLVILTATQLYMYLYCLRVYTSASVSVTWWYVVEKGPVSAGEVVKVLAGIHTVVHGSLDLHGQFQTCLTQTHIRRRI